LLSVDIQPQMAQASQSENFRIHTGRGGPNASGGDTAARRQGAEVEKLNAKGSSGGRFTQTGRDARTARGGLCLDNERAAAFPSPTPIVQSYAERFREDGRLADSMTVMAATSKNRSPHDPPARELAVFHHPSTTPASASTIPNVPTCVRRRIRGRNSVDKQYGRV
jgi:hypothetical protein